jgi:hypothetical protein
VHAKLNVFPEKLLFNPLAVNLKTANTKSEVQKAN